jgi:hypothetical protein
MKFQVEFDNEKGEHFEEEVDANTDTQANSIANGICDKLNSNDPQRMWGYSLKPKQS